MSNGAGSDVGLAAQVIRGFTLLAAEVAFVLLFGHFVIEAWQAAAGSPPKFSDVQVGAAGALAVAIGGGYATILGVEPAPANSVRMLSRSWWIKVAQFLKEQSLLFVGVVLYMVTGFAVAVTYASHEAETPGILKTFAVAFGGYVIAYLGAAFRRITV